LRYESTASILRKKDLEVNATAEKARGEAASVFTKGLINASQQRQVILYGWDKFGGRVLGDIILNGQSLRAQLIANGFAREYYGDAKQSWCQ
jgi:endonuclease YncB( thermonuclease family)